MYLKNFVIVLPNVEEYEARICVVPVQAFGDFAHMYIFIFYLLLLFNEHCGNMK